MSYKAIQFHKEYFRNVLKSPHSLNKKGVAVKAEPLRLKWKKPHVPKMSQEILSRNLY